MNKLFVYSMILLFPIPLFDSVNADINTPSWQVGDWWQYNSQYMQNGTNPLSVLYQNVTSLSHIENETTLNVNGNAYDVFTLTSDSIGNIWSFIEGGGSMSGYIFINQTSYYCKNNLSLVYSNAAINITNPTGYELTKRELTYLKSYDAYNYPIEINEHWYCNYSVAEKSYCVRVNGQTVVTQTWKNTTWFSNNSYSYIAEENIGPYTAYRIRVVDLDNPIISDAEMWVSSQAGNVVKMKNDYVSLNTYTYKILIAGYYNNNELPSVLPVTETNWMLLTIGTASIVWLIRSQKKYRHIFKHKSNQ